MPDRFRELYEALDEVKNTAPEQLSLSRLQLALRGLESETPLIRIAVLGLNDATAARKLVRLLLADPLNPKEDWEDILDPYNEDTSRGLLIRYGEVSETIHNDLLPTISIPSSVLKKGNMEILVSAFGADAVPPGAQVAPNTFLVPIVPIRTSHSGRQNFIRYPVHRALVCGSGVDGLLAYSGLVARSALNKDEKSVFGAIELPIMDKEKHNGRIAFVDIGAAGKALDKFRESVQNASEYERGWNYSGVQRVLDWLSSPPSNGHLDPALERLIGSLLDSAEEGVRAQEVRQIAQQEALSVSDQVREDLDQSISAWAERAHTELHHSLEKGFSSQNWRELAWWKLFWHVDDVGMITSEILEKRYLCQAEKELIWMSGRLQQAGLLNEIPDSRNVGDAAAAAATSQAGEVNENDEQTVVETTPSQPSQEAWPAQIPTSRSKLLNVTVPSLQALAQKLVLFSVSTTTLTSALSALTYISFPTASIYESCSIAAVGLAYSLRRQQKRWDSARTFWENEVREDGRTSLRETEHHLRAIVREGGRPAEDVSESAARDAIEKARRALEATK